jgi:hypothetical protein
MPNTKSKAAGAFARTGGHAPDHSSLTWCGLSQIKIIEAHKN